MLHNNNHTNPIGLVRVVYVVDSPFGAAASRLDDLGATSGKVDIACWIDSRVGLAASDCPALSVSYADMKEAIGLTDDKCAGCRHTAEWQWRYRWIRWMRWRYRWCGMLFSGSCAGSEAVSMLPKPLFL
jgi:hypothetical protein